MSGDSRNVHLKLVLTEDGIHLSDSILWFDAHKNKELSFLSSAHSCTHPLQAKVIATEETVRILEGLRSKPNALVCQYHRPFSLGKLRLEILPSGAMLGAASLYLERDKESLLYAPLLQMRQLPSQQAASIKPADALVLHAAYPEAVDDIDRPAEIERLMQKILLFPSQLPIIFCQSASCALEIAHHLVGQGVAVRVHKSYSTIHKAHGHSDLKLDIFEGWSKNNGNKVLLLPATLAHLRKARNRDLKRAQLLIESGFALPPGVADEFAANERFCLNSISTLPELIEVIKKIKPKSVYLFGTYTMRYFQRLKTQFPNIKPLYQADQPPLL